jgi:hypothetical protein
MATIIDFVCRLTFFITRLLFFLSARALSTGVNAVDVLGIDILNKFDISFSNDLERAFLKRSVR